MKLLMTMLAVLKFAGIFVLTVIAIVLVLLAVIAVCGIKYEAGGEYKDGRGNGNGFVSWLFGLVRVDFGIKNNSFDYTLKVPFLSLAKKARAGKAKPKSVAKAQDDTEKKAADDRQEGAAEKPSDKTINKRTVKSKQKKPKKAKNKTETKKKKLFGKADEEKSLPERLIYYYKHYELKKLYEPLKRLLKRLIHAIGIKHAQADVIFGLDDPSVTGMILGGSAAAAAFLPFRLNIKGFFGGEYLEARASISGKTSVLALMIPCIKMVFEKPVWNILMKLKG